MIHDLVCLPVSLSVFLSVHFHARFVHSTVSQVRGTATWHHDGKYIQYVKDHNNCFRWYMTATKNKGRTNAIDSLSAEWEPCKQQDKGNHMITYTNNPLLLLTKSCNQRQRAPSTATSTAVTMIIPTMLREVTSESLLYDNGIWTRTRLNGTSLMQLLRTLFLSVPGLLGVWSFFSLVCSIYLCYGVFCANLWYGQESLINTWSISWFQMYCIRDCVPYGVPYSRAKEDLCTLPFVEYNPFI